MPGVCTVNDSMNGQVGHHNNHITGYKQVLDRIDKVETGEDEDGNMQYKDVPVYRQDPVYCTGHSVTGKQTTGQTKLMIGGQPIATVGDSGTTNCPCDGKGYTNTEGSSKMFINGRAVVRSGDRVDIHGQGTGVMTSSSSKINIG